MLTRIGLAGQAQSLGRTIEIHVCIWIRSGRPQGRLMSMFFLPRGLQTVERSSSWELSYSDNACPTSSYDLWIIKKTNTNLPLIRNVEAGCPLPARIFPMEVIGWEPYALKGARTVRGGGDLYFLCEKKTGLPTLQCKGVEAGTW